MTLSDNGKALRELMLAMEEEDRLMKEAAEKVLFHLKKKEILMLAFKKLAGELK